MLGNKMSSESKFSGTVIWFDPKSGFGFISWEKNGVKQEDMFVHFSDIVMESFKVLKKNQLVSFKIGKNNKDKPKAIEVVVEDE
jgi:cold shock CspA family protein